MDRQSLIQKAIDIIQGTHDGDDLSPPHLKLTEMAVNGFLNESGIKLLDEIHKQVTSGTYTKPYLQGVEFMTQDHDGYIYFKDKNVEHYNRPWAYSLEAKDCLEDMQHRCLFLESKGIKVSFGNAMDMPEELSKEYHEQFIRRLDELTKGYAVVFSSVRSYNGYTIQRYLIAGTADESKIWNNPYAKDFMENSDEELCNGKFKSNTEEYIYGSGKQRDATPEEIKEIKLCFAYLKGKNLVNYIGKNEYQLDTHLEIEEDDDEEMEI